MARIRILSDHLANRIAAGEVVERPASVVKELVENSLDAGADRISIEVEGDGTKLIRVSDNGCGMDQADLLLCLERHATSKIYEEGQLAALTSLGFRGEALPSIASVSRMQILSRPSQTVTGTELEVRYGLRQRVQEVGCACGTVVEVRHLFGTLPVRRKFLKSRRTELAHIEENLCCLALAFPSVAFSLDVDGRRLLNLAPAEEEERMQEIFHQTGTLLRVQESLTTPQIRLRAWLFLPPLSRPARLRIVVNQRPVHDFLIRQALGEGLYGLLMQGQQAAGAFILDIAPQSVDINVHPTKRELRFRTAKTVQQCIIEATRKAVQGHQQAAPSRCPSPPSPSLAKPLGVLHQPALLIAEESPSYGGLKPLGQFLNLYLLCEQQQQLVLIDQHAAYERLLYEQLCRSGTGQGLAQQRLPFPVTVDVTPRHADILEQEGEKIASLGLRVEFFGGTTWIIKAVPELLSPLPAQELLQELLQGLALQPPPVLLDRLFAPLACKVARKVAPRLQPKEVLELLEQLGGSASVSHCPDGRPVVKIFSLSEIEKWFK
jgi:DNA mismatch repair protein MutL